MVQEVLDSEECISQQTIDIVKADCSGGLKSTQKITSRCIIAFAERPDYRIGALKMLDWCPWHESAKEVAASVYAYALLLTASKNCFSVERIAHKSGGQILPSNTPSSRQLLGD